MDGEDEVGDQGYKQKLFLAMLSTVPLTFVTIFHRLDITNLEEKFRGATQLIMSLFVHSPPSPFMGFHLRRIAHDLLRVAMARKFSRDTLSRLEDFERSLEKQSMPILNPGRVQLNRAGVGHSGLQAGGRDRALTAPVSKADADDVDGHVREVWGTVRKASGGSASAPEIAQRSSGRQGLLGGLKAQVGSAEGV